MLATMALTLLVASGLALVAGVGSATAESSVVGPGATKKLRKSPLVTLLVTVGRRSPAMVRAHNTPHDKAKGEGEHG